MQVVLKALITYRCREQDSWKTLTSAVEWEQETIWTQEKVPFILLIIHAGKKRLSCLNDYPKAKISRQGDLKSSKSGENKQKYLPTIYCFLPLTLKSCLTKRQIYCAAQMSRQCNSCFKTEARDRRSQCQAKGHGLVLLGALRVNRNKLKCWTQAKKAATYWHLILQQKCFAG